MPPHQRACKVLDAWYGFPAGRSDWQEQLDGLPGLGPLIEQAIGEAVKEERRRCAQVAWDMQMRDFGGGTAIGNAIEEGSG